MSRSKRAAAFLVGIVLVWMGLCQIGTQVPFAGERQAPAAGSRLVRETKTALPVGAVELRCPMEQQTTILSIVPPGESVKEGDLLVELDVAALVDKRIQQVLDVKKAETEMILATDSQNREKRAAAGQVALAEKALRLAQAQLKAYIDGEYVHQLAMAQGTLAIAGERRTLAEHRMNQLRTSFETQKDEGVVASLQEAQIALQETKLRLAEAEGALALLKGFVHDNKIAELELVIAQREFNLARAEDAVSAAATRGAATVFLAETIFRREADRLAKLDDQIVKCKIYAPQDGTVDQPRDADEAAIKPGAVVRERQLLVRLLPVKASKS